MDDEGTLYKWDESKIQEIGTVYDYSFMTTGIDLLLAEKCKAKFKAASKQDSFVIKIEESLLQKGNK